MAGDRHALFDLERFAGQRVGAGGQDDRFTGGGAGDRLAQRARATVVRVADGDRRCGGPATARAHTTARSAENESYPDPDTKQVSHESVNRGRGPFLRPPGLGRERTPTPAIRIPSAVAPGALAGGVEGGLAEGVGEQDRVGRDRRREQRVLDGEQAVGEAGRDRQRDRQGDPVVVQPVGERGGDDQAAAVPTARRTRRRKVSSCSGRRTKRIVSGIQKPCSSMPSSQ